MAMKPDTFSLRRSYQGHKIVVTGMYILAGEYWSLSVSVDGEVTDQSLTDDLDDAVAMADTAVRKIDGIEDEDDGFTFRRASPRPATQHNAPNVVPFERPESPRP